MSCLKLFLLFCFFSLLSIYALGQANENKKNSDSTDIKHELAKSTTVNTIITKVKEVGPTYYQILTHPKKFTKKWIETPEKSSSALAALSFSLLITFFCYGLYKLIFKISPINKFIAAFGSNVIQGSKERPAAKLNPRIVAISTKMKRISASADGSVTSVSTETSINPLPGFDFPEAGIKSMDEPQLIIFHVGLLHVFWDGIVPANFSTKKALAIINLLYAFICVICLYPIANLLGSKITFSETFAFSIYLFSFAFLYFSLLIFLAVIVVFNFFKIKFDFANDSKKNFSAYFAGGCLWVLLTFGVIMTIFFIAFKTFYGFILWKFLLMIVGAFAISLIVCPIIFIPFMYIYLRFRKVIDFFY